MEKRIQENRESWNIRVSFQIHCSRDFKIQVHHHEVIFHQMYISCPKQQMRNIIFVLGSLN
jgi:hypothetical protein